LKTKFQQSAIFYALNIKHETFESRVVLIISHNFRGESMLDREVITFFIVSCLIY